MPDDKTYHVRLELDFDSDNEADSEMEVMQCTQSDKQTGIDRLNSMNPRPANYGLKVTKVLQVVKEGATTRRPRLVITAEVEPAKALSTPGSDYQKKLQDARFEKSAKAYNGDFCKIRSVQSYGKSK